MYFLQGVFSHKIHIAWNVSGGLLTKGITEIVGESASGKTQVCLQLCLCVQLPVKYGGLAGGKKLCLFVSKIVRQQRRVCSFLELLKVNEPSKSIF